MSTSSDLSGADFSSSPFLGAVPEGQATAEPMALSLAGGDPARVAAEPRALC